MSPKMIRWLGLALISGLLLGHALLFNFINDDAFISFRYADNLQRHGELVFNLGERVEGYTNFLWTILMAGVMALGQEPVFWSKALGILFGLGSLGVLARFSGRLSGRSLWDLLPALLLAIAPAYACWSTGGLETQLFTFLTTLAWTEYLLEREKRYPLSGLLFALSAMARPEGMLFFGLTGLHRLIELIIQRRWPERRDWIWGVGFLSLFGPYYAWRWIYYGWPFPNTYYVKTGARSFWKPGFNYFWSWVSAHQLWILPGLLVVRPRLPAGKEGRLLSLLLLYLLALCFHVIRVGGDFMALHRFFVPIMPALALLAAQGIRGLVERFQETGLSRLRLSLAALLLSLLLGAHIVRVDREALKVGSQGGVDSIGWLNLFAEQCSAIGRWLGEHAEADSSIAITAAGIIPYYSRLYTVDILALNDEYLAHNIPARGNRPGHTKSAPLKYLLEKEVDYMIYHPSMAKRPLRKGRGERKTWKQRGYEWKSWKIPDLKPPWWGCWQKISDKNQP